MSPIKLSMIASVIGASVGLQEINDAFESSQELLFKTAYVELQNGVISNRPICIPGFPNVSEEFDEFEFKIFRGHARAYGFKEIKLIVLAYDTTQAQRLVDIFTREYDKLVQRKRPNENGAVSHMYDEDISPDEVIKYVNTSGNGSTYTLFNEQLFT